MHKKTVIVAVGNASRTFCNQHLRASDALPRRPISITYHTRHIQDPLGIAAASMRRQHLCRPSQKFVNCFKTHNTSESSRQTARSHYGFQELLRCITHPRPRIRMKGANPQLRALEKFDPLYQTKRCMWQALHVFRLTRFIVRNSMFR